jgi:hypothetical protein
MFYGHQLNGDPVKNNRNYMLTETVLCLQHATHFGLKGHHQTLYIHNNIKNKVGRFYYVSYPRFEISVFILIVLQLLKIINYKLRQKFIQLITVKVIM